MVDVYEGAWDATRMTDSSSRGQSVELTNISKGWEGVPAVHALDMQAAPGTFTVLLGPSGCGKSTTLRIIAGLEHADDGNVRIGGREVSDLPPSRRDIAMVFQSYALFPHLSVAENILFGLKVRKTPKPEQQSKLRDTAELLGLSDYLKRKPSQLSGGQQQRVALGRAIIADKPICLMDEPLSNLDAKLRNTMRVEIRELQQSLGFTMIYVTHDQAEAITMADQVVLLHEGRVAQATTPREIYERPASAFVAGFIGTPPMNLVPADVLAAHVHAQHKQASDVFLSGANPGDIQVGVRPEQIRVSDDRGVRAVIRSVEYLGADTLAECSIEGASMLARVSGSSRLSVGDTVSLTWPSTAMHFFSLADGTRRDDVRSNPSNVFD